MKVQIFEQFHGGHYTTYIQHLLPQLLAQGHEVVVTLTAQHRASSAFVQQLSAYEEAVRFDTQLAEVDPHIALNPQYVLRHPRSGLASVKRLSKLVTGLVEAVWREQPDCLIVTTADLQNMLMAFYKRLRQPLFPPHTRTIGIFHYGYSGAVETVSDRLKSWIYQKTWQQSPFDHLLLVNPVAYEWVKQHDSHLASRISLAADPVASLQPFTQAAARQRLGLATEGRYIGFVGAMDHRVAIPELVAAYRKLLLDEKTSLLGPFISDGVANLQQTRLLLAGKLHPDYKTHILAHQQDLIDAGRLILMDRYLSVEELCAGYQALDLITPLYYKKPNLSANLLKAVMAERPVIVNDFGYTGMMTKRFRLGWACDVLNSDDLTQTLQQALTGHISYARPEILRLKQFHTPENYAATVLKAMHPQPSVYRPTPSKSWQWVTAAAP
ncbi:MAG: hypothetical protein HLUCCA11_06875 [Phormidesmis priestleyi Ana]|uniref:Uncharacterized protein n=1 Tax=Phormidesmis priestleyi Ana TaxID=1666911 RepID=A0A0P8A053_9CYAN|nr:MAG: hypothetical protein HLUCCA11_06875 [Phormidesmis priestleyi Ana]